jgi:hypothetical protein
VGVVTTTLTTTTTIVIYMPTRSASITDSVYLDIHKEMDISGRTYSFVVNRRLERLMDLENPKPEKKNE